MKYTEEKLSYLLGLYVRQPQLTWDEIGVLFRRKFPTPRGAYNHLLRAAIKRHFPVLPRRKNLRRFDGVML
jgi:hypothetical protein